MLVGAIGDFVQRHHIKRQIAFVRRAIGREHEVLRRGGRKRRRLWQRRRFIAFDFHLIRRVAHETVAIDLGCANDDRVDARLQRERGIVAAARSDGSIAQRRHKFAIGSVNRGIRRVEVAAA